MTMMTYDRALAPAERTVRKGFWARVYDRLIEARTRHAMRELELYRHLMPRELEDAGWKVTERSEDSLPFIR